MKKVALVITLAWVLCLLVVMPASAKHHKKQTPTPTPTTNVRISNPVSSPD